MAERIIVTAGLWAVWTGVGGPRVGLCVALFVAGLVLTWPEHIGRSTLSVLSSKGEAKS